MKFRIFKIILHLIIPFSKIFIISAIKTFLSSKCLKNKILKENNSKIIYYAMPFLFLCHAGYHYSTSKNFYDYQIYQ